MAVARCLVEAWVGGAFRTVGQVSVLDDEAGYRGAARFEYDLDYVETALGAIDARAVSCRYPVSYSSFDEEVWPSFLLDLMPSGAARRFWEAELSLPNTPRSDWAMLARGGGNPPGNVRIVTLGGSGPEGAVAAEHPGFTRDEVIERGERFLEYARAHGAPIAGSSGAAGDSPKFLLREDARGRFHADGVLPDARTRRSWLVKFPRSPREADRLILQAEAGYWAVARELGARVGEPLAWERDALFVPRFDRPQAGGRVERLGLESLASLAGVTEFGAPTPKDDLVAAVLAVSSDPLADLRELVLRDVLDVAMGNTDNHARNTAVLKDARGGVRVAPLYDFAPMMLDPAIARVCRWRGDEVGGYPTWDTLADTLGRLGVTGADAAEVRGWLAELAPAVAALPATMRAAGVPGRVVEAAEHRIERVARGLPKEPPRARGKAAPRGRARAR